MVSEPTKESIEQWRQAAPPEDDDDWDRYLDYVGRLCTARAAGDEAAEELLKEFSDEERRDAMVAAGQFDWGDTGAVMALPPRPVKIGGKVVGINPEPNAPAENVKHVSQNVRHAAQNGGSQNVQNSGQNAVGILGGLLERLRSGDGDVLFSFGPALEGFEIGPGLLCVAGAPPGFGKTALAMQGAFEFLQAHQDQRLVVANCETTPEVLLKRELTRRSGVPSRALRFAELKAQQLDAVEAAAKDLSPLLERVEFMGPPYSVEQLAGLQHDEPGLVIVDYLQRFAGDKQDARAGVGAVMTALRTLCHAGWAVLALSATTRGHGKGGSTHDSSQLSMASFRESGEIEFGADAAYLLRDEGPADDGGDFVRNVVLDCAKNRHGERGRLELAFDMPAMEFRQREPEKHDFGIYEGSPFETAESGGRF